MPAEFQPSVDNKTIRIFTSIPNVYNATKDQYREVACNIDTHSYTLHIAING